MQTSSTSTNDTDETHERLRDGTIQEVGARNVLPFSLSPRRPQPPPLPVQSPPSSSTDWLQVHASLKKELSEVEARFNTLLASIDRAKDNPLLASKSRSQDKVSPVSSISSEEEQATPSLPHVPSEAKSSPLSLSVPQSSSSPHFLPQGRPLLLLVALTSLLLGISITSFITGTPIPNLFSLLWSKLTTSAITTLVCVCAIAGMAIASVAFLVSVAFILVISTEVFVKGLAGLRKSPASAFALAAISHMAAQLRQLSVSRYLSHRFDAPHHPMAAKAGPEVMMATKAGPGDSKLEGHHIQSTPHTRISSPDEASSHQLSAIKEKEKETESESLAPASITALGSIGH